MDRWQAERPLGISVAATLTETGELRLWHGGPLEAPAPQMSQEDAAELLSYLHSEQSAGRRVVTWNGLGFDFDVLAEESAQHALTVEVALEHIDIMFTLYCDLGFLLSLQAAAEGCGASKMEGMSGDLAPLLWARGEYERVKAYVAQDVRATAAVYRCILENGGLGWRSRRELRQWWSLSGGKLPTVREAMAWPVPDQS